MTSIARRRAQARFERTVARTIVAFRMAGPGDHVLVALSGGPDSTALLHCLHALAPDLGLSVSAAHLNHRLRASEADEDEAFSRAACARLGIPFKSETVEVGRKAAAEKMNLEEAGRKARMAFLRRTAREIGATRIALGHTVNDQAETVLMRLFRGSGVEGLAAIHPVVDGVFVRPLLECSREEVLRYLRSRDAPYREDSSNLDIGYRRNRVRLELIPYLEKWFNPELVQALARHARLSREAADFLRKSADRALSDIAEECPVGMMLCVDRLVALHPLLQKTILRLALERVGGSARAIASSHLDDILSLCEAGRSGRQVAIPGKRFASRQFNQLLLGSGRPPVPAAFCYELQWPGSVRVPELDLEVVASVGQSPPKGGDSAGSERALLDAQSVPKTLYVRSRLPGDRYGESGGRKKVKRLLIDARVPLRARADIPMVASEDSVLWIPGFRPARSAAMRASSRRVLTLEVRRHSKTRNDSPTERKHRRLKYV